MMSWTPRKLTKAQLEERRFAACDYFEQGITNCAQIAEQLGASRSMTHAWYRIFQIAGRDGLRQKQHLGPGKQITTAQITLITETLMQGASSYGFEGDYWTSKRIVIVIADLTNVSYHFNHVSKLLSAWGFSYQKPEKRHVKRDEAKIADWLTEQVPILKKLEAQQPQGRHHIFFCDIASASLEPSVLKTWGLIGQTPSVRLNSGGHQFGVIGGISCDGEIYGQAHFGSMTGEGTVSFLGNLLERFEGRVVVVFDNGRNVKCEAVRRFVEVQPRLEILYLPPYAPDCNPIELLWAWIRRDLGSVCFSGVKALLDAWCCAWLEVVKAPDLVKSFFRGSRIGDLST